jgi:hypothetical protein
MKLVKAVRWLVGAVQALGELVGAGRKLAKAARSGKLPHAVDDTDPIPLSPRQPLKPIVVPPRSGQKK